MTFLLMVFLAVVCLFESYPTPPWGGPRWLAAALTAVGVLTLAGHAAYLAWRTRRRIDADPAGLDRHLAGYDRGRANHALLGLTLYLVTLLVCGWGWLVRGDGESPAGPGTEILLLTPFVLGQALSWYFFYDADRAAHAATHRPVASPFAPALDAGQMTVPAFGGRWSYIGFQLRQRLALAFLPVLLLVVRQEAARLLPARVANGPAMAWILTAGALGSVFIALPLLIRVVLGLRPLPAGRLRDRLEATARRLGFRMSDLLVWDTRHGMANAMIVGVLPWLRYVVFTDRMLEEFPEEEIQAVFGHELGHVKHHHMQFYLVFLTVSIVMLTLIQRFYLMPALAGLAERLDDALPGWLPEGFAGWWGEEGTAALLIAVGLMVGYIFLVFGFLSRRCERQADVYGCRAVSCSEPGCREHGGAVPYAVDGSLCATGIRAFAQALDRVAIVNGIDRERPGFFASWQHSTIARRVAFLRGMMNDNRLEPRFQGRLTAIKWGLMAALAVTIVGLIVQNGM